MIHKLLNYLLSIFYKGEKETSLSVKTWHPKSDVVPKLEGESHPEIKKHSDNPKKIKSINKGRVMSQIKSNLHFLDTLIVEMEPFDEYVPYVVKLKDLKEQSQGCLRILFRIKEEAPYFEHTLKTIQSHTRTVSELLED